MYEWGDLRFFLATANSGSTLAAARMLGVNQTTVARRIAALEAALSVRLFHRRQDGYRLSEVGSAIMTQAERVAAEAETIKRLIAERGRDLSGVIRVTTVENIANTILTPLLSEFMELYPDIKVEVITAERRLDLSRGEADIAIRACQMPTEPGITVRKLADDPWALFCSRAYANKHGIPKSRDDLIRHTVIGAEGRLAKLDPFIWLTRAAPDAKVRSVCNTVANAAAAIKAGQGVGPLPCAARVFEGPELVECFVLPPFKIGYYLLTRADMKNLPRVKAFKKFIVSRAPALKRMLEGRSGKKEARMNVGETGR